MVSSISSIWFMSQPAVRICATFVAFSRVCSNTVVVGALGPSSSSGIYLISACIVLSLCLCCVCSSMPWHCCPCRQQFLTFPFPLSPNCRLSCAGFISIYLFIYSFIYLCFPPLSHLALKCDRCSEGAWGKRLAAGL